LLYSLTSSSIVEAPEKNEGETGKY